MTRNPRLKRFTRTRPHWATPAAITLCLGAAAAQKYPDLRLDTDITGNKYSTSARTCANGDRVYVVWTDNREGASDIYFQSSDDRGQTWLPNDMRLDTDAPGSEFSFSPAIACAENNVYVVWSDLRNGGSLKSDIYFNRSTDNGATWLSSDLRLDTDPTESASRCPSICAEGTQVYVAWNDARNGQNDVYFNSSRDFGAPGTWLASDIRINSDAPGHSHTACPTISCTPGKVYVAWNDLRNSTPDVFFNRSIDGGVSFLRSDIRINTNPIGESSTNHVSLNANANHVYLAWWDDRNGDDDIYFNRSVDSGLTFGTTDVRLDVGDPPGASRSNWPEIASDDTNVYVAWEEQRLAQSPQACVGRVFMNRSADRGATWLPTDVQVSRAPPCGSSNPDDSPILPRITAGNGTVYVVWEDARNGRPDIFLNRSTDNGANWLSADMQLDRDGPGTSASHGPSIAYGNDTLYVAWEDNRNGATDIYFNIPLGAQMYGQGKPGSGGFVPKLEGRGSTGLGRHFELRVTGSVGGTVAALVVGTAKASAPFLGGTMFVLPITAVPVPIGGSATTPGTGTAAIPFVAPEDETFIGSSMFLQIIPIDLGSSGGISMTNAIEVWIG